MSTLLSTEFAAAFGLLGTCFLATIGSLMAWRGAQSPISKPVEFENIIQNAPYHRLHNVVTIRQD